MSHILDMCIDLPRHFVISGDLRIVLRVGIPNLHQHNVSCGALISTAHVSAVCLVVYVQESTSLQNILIPQKLVFFNMAISGIAFKHVLRAQFSVQVSALATRHRGILFSANHQLTTGHDSLVF